MSTSKLRKSPFWYTKEQHLNSNRILFVDDMQASHVVVRQCIARYNLERKKQLVLEESFSVAEMIKNLSGCYMCGLFDWNLGSNDLNERGDKAIEATNGACFHKSVLTRMYDDKGIQGYCTRNGVWYIIKDEKGDALYEKVRDYLDYVFHWLRK